MKEEAGATAARAGMCKRLLVGVATCWRLLMHHSVTCGACALLCRHSQVMHAAPQHCGIFPHAGLLAHAAGSTRSPAAAAGVVRNKRQSHHLSNRTTPYTTGLLFYPSHLPRDPFSCAAEGSFFILLPVTFSHHHH